MVTTGFKTALKRESTTLIALLCIWVGAIILQVNSPQWVTIKDTLTATLVQGNLSQDEKWLVEQAAPSLAYYQQASLDNISSDLIVWPETAITYLYHQVYDYLIPFQDELIETKTTVISGVPYWDSEQASYHNAVWAMGEGFGLYFKQRLVPFGEYIPMQTIVGKILDIFGMPMSMFSPGPENQPVLQVREWGVAAFICYEIVYPELVRQLVRDSDFLLTISNDGWFGASIGPIQHLQIAQFRAKESGRYVIRATNTGVTAIIDHQGVITAAAPQFVRTTLTGTVGIASGVTPYVRHGDFVILTLILGLFILQLLQSVILIRRNHF